MALKVEVYQKENVRPIRPTPESLRSYGLSSLDQLAGTFYMPLLFFYQTPGGGDGSHRRHDYDELKDSLSKTLSVFYPLAGRLKDGLTVVCNDEGADFVRANVTNYDLSDLLQHPKLDLLRQLFPRDPYPTAFDPAQPLLAVQANRFRCGGTVVAICLWHAVADGSGLAGFLQTWAAINRGEVAATNCNVGSFIADSTGVFQPVKNLDVSESISSFAERRKRNRGKYSAKRYVFSPQEIERIKEECNNQYDERRPTRVEALSAFIWAAVIRATLQANKKDVLHLLTNAVDLRKRMSPQFPSTCLGNIIQLTAARWEAVVDNAKTGAVTAGSLIGRVREAIGKVTDDYVRTMHANGGYLKAVTATGKQADITNDIKILSISTWFKFECLKVDFGWGKAIWVGSGNNLEDLALFLDGIDGGVEVWIGLPRQIMCNLDKDDEFLAHVSFSQILWESPHLSTRL